MFTICVVICVYVKENYRLIKRFFRLEERRAPARHDRVYEKEVLRNVLAEHGPDHLELAESEEDENDPSVKNSKKVMNFYLDMMTREIFNSENATLDKDDSREEPNENDGLHCYPLCDKKFKNGEVLRRIHPCGHLFHENCIKVWLYRGENQYCPACRGNIMKP